MAMAKNGKVNGSRPKPLRPKPPSRPKPKPKPKPQPQPKKPGATKRAGPLVLFCRAEPRKKRGRK